MKRRFRSGTGGQYSGNSWEDWDGLSPNGRQYRNSITGETRSLTGAEYWHARKADHPEQEPDTWKNGKANIAAFADKESESKVDSLEKLEYKIFPQQKTYDNLEKLEAQLNERLEKGLICPDEYDSLYAGIQAKKERAWKNLCKAKGWTEESEDVLEGQSVTGAWTVPEVPKKACKATTERSSRWFDVDLVKMVVFTLVILIILNNI